MARRRLDAELVRRGIFETTEAARQAIESREVLLNGSSAVQAGTMVEPSSAISVAHTSRFASRGGDKLSGALEDLHIEVEGRSCLDAGAGSGGFTDCLLEAAARHVVAVDVGYGQFEWRLRNDPRVTLLERTNLRTAEPTKIGGPFDLVVADLSFISLRLLVEKFAEVSAQDGDWVLLVKPQFEASKGQVGPGGIVKDPDVWRQVLTATVMTMHDAGAGAVAAAPSRVKGAKGNQEFFIHARMGQEPIRGVVDEALKMVQ